MPEPTDGERAAFEAGIKFGALYHQFAGTPVTPESAESLATAMEEAIENQPFCERVDVRPKPEAIRATIGDVSGGGGSGGDAEASDVADYTELTGTLFDATVTVERDGTRVEAALETRDDYPLMRVVDVERR